MVKKSERGRLIVFEGTDGTGKSTQLGLLADHLKNLGYKVVATKEPTDGHYGRKIRDLYLNRESYSPSTELELFISDRKEHVTSLLLPSLEEGNIVLCDRYFLSTVAYQGARGFDTKELLSMNSFAPDPDLALLFRAPPETGLTRITTTRGDTPNDFEDKENLASVAAIFDSIDRQYIHPVNATGTIKEISQRVLDLVLPLLPAPPNKLE